MGAPRLVTRAMTWLDFPLYRVGAWLVCRVPERWDAALIAVVSGFAAAVMRGRRRMVARHLERVGGRPLHGAERRRAVRASFRSYARYWLDTLRLTELDRDDLAPRVDASEVTPILDRALGAGRGVVLATAHFGSWDLGGAWLADPGYRLITVVERLRSQRLLEWFADLRGLRGMAIVVRGPSARDQLVAALARNEAVVLVCDRDLGGRGVPVDFFGERTTLPHGPAWLARTCGASLVPVAIYHVGDGRHRGVALPAVEVPHGDDERDDVAVASQRLADALEELVREAPEQWHLMVPNWPSDTPDRPTPSNAPASEPSGPQR